MSIEVLSQILATTGIFASQEEYILTTFNKLSNSPQRQEDLGVSIDFPFPSSMETKESSTKEDPLEPEIEHISPCLSTNLVSILETNYPSLFGMIEEDF
jgi:hypothetical protein